MKKREVTVSTVVIPRNGIISPLKNRVKTKTIGGEKEKKKKKNENNSTCFLRANLNSESAVTIITDVSPLLPPPHAWILLFPLIHSFALFSPPTLRALKKKKNRKKKEREEKKRNVHLSLCSSGFDLVTFFSPYH